MWNTFLSNIQLLFISPLDGLFILGGFFLVVATHLFFWYRVGRDPDPTTAQPLVYEPPEGLSPAALRYIWKNSADSRCLAAAVLSLAAKGVIKIEKTGRSFRIKPGMFAGSMSREEAAIARRLLQAGGPVDLEWGYGHSLVHKIKKVLGRELGKGFKDVYFASNLKYAIPGNAVAVLTASPYIYIMSGDLKFTFGLLLFICVAVGGINDLVQRTGQSIGGMINKETGCLIAFLGLMAVFGATPFLLFAPGLVFPILFTPLACLVFMILMATPTPLGLRLMIQVEGFRHFLDVTERDNLQRFPDFNTAAEGAAGQMPYLLALDVEHPWTEAFADTIDGLLSGVVWPDTPKYVDDGNPLTWIKYRCRYNWFTAHPFWSALIVTFLIPPFVIALLD